MQLAKGARPRFSRPIAAALRSLVERLWHHDPMLRPPFVEVQKALEAHRASLLPADFVDRAPIARVATAPKPAEVPGPEPGPEGGCCAIS